MQNDLNANRAVVALKRLEMEHLRQQALYSVATLTPSGPVVKMELPTEYPLLVPKEELGHKHRGRKPRSAKVVQCRIPIAAGPQPGPSTPIDEHEDQQNMVKKITNLLIKHNFMQNKSGQKQISELVAKVRRMVATGQPMTLGPGYDELSSSIANVLLHREEVQMPALTDIDPPIVPIPEVQIRKRGRPKAVHPIQPEIPMPPLVPMLEIDGRRRRKAALAAEMQFDTQKDVIDLDDDGDWQNVEAEVIEDEPIEQVGPPESPQPIENENVPEEQSNKGNKSIENNSSIVVSDDEALPEVKLPATPSAIPAATRATTTSNTGDSEVVALHPSLLTNSNFIKIVAHTYLAGNPMMDEDAATLAAQYSTLKTLKEAESEGRQIESGAVYDIAVQVCN